MDDYREALGFALELAELGARIAMGHFGTDVQSKQKDDGTWVTEVDWAVEAQIRLRIARAFPEHNILGEEEGLTAAGGGEARPGRPTWVIDPIDGTNNYKSAIPIWATLVGLQIEGRSVVGVAQAPALGETYQGALGLGARLNESPIAVDPLSDLTEATVLYGSWKHFAENDLSDFYEQLAAKAWRTRGLGDFWGHMLVARGAAHVMVEPSLSAWDVAALQPIVEEAGGRLTHLDGSDWSGGGSVLTSNGTLHDEVVQILD